MYVYIYIHTYIQIYIYYGYICIFVIAINLNSSDVCNFAGIVNSYRHFSLLFIYDIMFAFFFLMYIVFCLYSNEDVIKISRHRTHFLC